MRVSKSAIKDGDGTYGLRATIGAIQCHVDTNAAVHYGDRVICPTPVPKLINGCDSIIETKIAHGELLVPKPSCTEATVKNHITYEATRP